MIDLLRYTVKVYQLLMGNSLTHAGTAASPSEILLHTGKPIGVNIGNLSIRVMPLRGGKKLMNN